MGMKEQAFPGLSMQWTTSVVQTVLSRIQLNKGTVTAAVSPCRELWLHSEAPTGDPGLDSALQ